MPSCIPGSNENWRRSSRGVQRLLRWFQKGDAGKIGIHSLPPSNWTASILRCVCSSSWIIWPVITAAISSPGARNTALGCCTRRVPVPGSIWLSRYSASSSAERWRDSMSMTWKSSKTGCATPLRGGIGSRLLSSGEASGMLVVTAPMPVAIGRGDQERPLNLCCHDAFVPCVITNGSAMPSQLASDPLGTIGNWERGYHLPRDRAIILELAKQLRLDRLKRDQLLEAALLDPVGSIWTI